VSPAALVKKACAVLAVVPLAVQQSPGCAGSASLGTFRLLVRRSNGGAALAIRSVSVVPAGSHLVWEPVHLPAKQAGEAEVAAILVPPSGEDLVVLKPKKAGARAEWQVDSSPAAVALVYGPQGLSAGKVKSLVTRDQALVGQIADYAEQTSKVETLVQELSDAEQSGVGTDAALKGFSARFNVDVPKLDAKASTNQQAATLLKTVLPGTNAYDPLAARNVQMQQSAGLAASVAGLFFGSSVGLAAGGTALLGDIKDTLFPGTEFRSAFAQNEDKGALALCTKTSTPKARTRIAYLWAYRVPNLKPPVLSIVGPAYLPLGVPSTLRLASSKGTVKQLDKAREWRLVAAAGGASTPVGVHLASQMDSVQIDLTHTKIQPGDYGLEASWDWDRLDVAGTLHLLPLGDLDHAAFSTKSRDRLIEGSGVVTASLVGNDFEFVEKAAVAKASVTPAKLTETHFHLPLGKRAGPQTTLEVDIDTAARGSYLLLLTQADGKSSIVPYTVLPPNPAISGLPVRLNQGEALQPLVLQGTGTDRIEALSSEAGEIKGAAKGSTWSGMIQLKPETPAGAMFSLTMQVKGLSTPVIIPDAIKVFGPRRVITAVRKSAPGTLGLTIHPNELPSGITVGLSIEVQQYHDPSASASEARPRVELGCKSGGLRKTFSLAPDEHIDGAELTVAAPGMLFLAIDPAMVGYPGCVLTATVDVEPEGRSDAFSIGRVARVPHLDQFTLTNEQIDASTYSGILKGRDLDVIEKTGWDPRHGLPIDSVPTPVSGEPGLQTIRIAMPWPSPAPHTPLYVWFRGDKEGRKTSLTY
jgi:hypothetical protein